MNESETEARVQELHGLFCDLTDQHGLSLRWDRARMWHEWMRCGWSDDDLRVVVRYIRRGIADGRRNPGALKFRNLIGQPDLFEEELLEARRVLRIRQPRPPTVECKQALPGGGERIIEVPRDDPPVDVAQVFSALREQLSRNKSS